MRRSLRLKTAVRFKVRLSDIPITATQTADEQVGKLSGSKHEILGLLNVG